MAFKRIRLYLPEISLILLMFAILGLMFLFNDIIKHIGMANLEIKLIHKNREDSNKDFLGMLAKYKLHKRLYEERISEHELNLSELKTNYLTSLKDRTAPVELKRYQRVYRPALFVLNGQRRLLGLAPIELEVETLSAQYLRVGYYLERNKSYTSALKLYDGALEKVSPLDHRYPIIMLHQGFCHSIIGNYERAKERYNRVIHEHSDKKIAETAAILLSYITDFEQEVTRIKLAEDDSIEKSEKLFKLIAYDDALRTLDKLTPADEEEAEKINFYKARSNEELGNTTKSVEIYQDIIDTNPKSEYSKLSNRRILSISSTSSNSDLKELSVRNNQRIEDPQFESFKEIVESSTEENSENSLEVIKEIKINDNIISNIVEEHLEIEKSEALEIKLVEKVSVEKVALVEEFKRESDGNVVAEDKEEDETTDKVEIDKTTEDETVSEEKKDTETEETVKEKIVIKEVIKPDPAAEEQKRQLELLRRRMNQLIATNRNLARENARLEDQLSDSKNKSTSEIESLKEQQENLKESMNELNSLKSALEKQVEDLTKAREEQEREKSLEEKTEKVAEDFEGKKREKQQEVVTNRDQYGRIISRITYRWNEKDEKVTENYSIYYYRNDGKNFKIMEYDGEHKLTSYLIIEYDDEGNQTKIVRYDAEGNVKFE